MNSKISRRDFLRMAGMLPLTLGLPPFLRRPVPGQVPADGQKNVIVIVFDAFSANHIPFHGYPRQTAPNLGRLAERAIVYHNHHAGGNFTTPGTASLLTGTLPWTHRAFQLNGQVSKEFEGKTIFRAFERYHRIAYSHNPLVNTLFKQFAADLDEFVPQDHLFVTADVIAQGLFGRDEDIADVGWTRTIKSEQEGYSYSLFLSNLYKRYMRNRIASVAPRFPRGLPSIRGDSYFLLEDAIDWIQSETSRLPQPYFGYFHLMPPHAPCSPPVEFYGTFAKDGFVPPAKPQDVFSSDLLSPELLRQRTKYDEYILYLDREFGRLFDHLESTGVLDNTWVIVTSDHGELFERGVRGHISPLLYEPVLHIPLMIFEPGRRSRMDIKSLTSAIDVLPTLLHVTGQNPVPWAEGSLLPPFAPTGPDPEHVVYSLHAKRNDPEEALTHATATLTTSQYKLMYFFGYEELGEGVERLELYDIQSDPEELRNLYEAKAEISSSLLAVLKQKLKDVNQPYLT